MLSGDRDVLTEFVPGSFRAFELVFLQLILLWIIYRQKSHDQTGCLRWSSELLKNWDANDYYTIKWSQSSVENKTKQILWHIFKV